MSVLKARKIDDTITRMALYLIDIGNTSDDAIREASHIFFPSEGPDKIWTPDNFTATVRAKIQKLQKKPLQG